MKNGIKILVLCLSLTFIMSSVVPIKKINNKTAIIDSRRILRNLQYIPHGGVPGDLVVFGERASVVLTNSYGLPVIALSNYGKGKAIALTHTSYFDDEFLQKRKGRIFISNLLNLSHRRDKSILCVDAPHLGKMLSRKFRKVKSVKKLPSNFSNFNYVFFRLPHGYDASFRDKQVESLRNYIARGGILISTAIGWVFQHYGEGKQGKPLHEFYGNKLYLPMGIYWNNKYASGINKQYHINKSYGNRVHLLRSINNSINKINKKLTVINTSESRKEFNLFQNSLKALPDPGMVFSDVQLQSLMKRFQVRIEKFIPTNMKPVSINNSEAVYLISLVDAILKKSTNRINIPSLASEFPGKVNVVNPIKKKITVDTSIPKWHSTGLYAPPGAEVIVEIQEDVITSGLGIQIGCHSDKIDVHDKWKRWPDLINKKKLTSKRTIINNPHGGLVYITVPLKVSTKIVKAKISGAVQSPYFILNKTSLSEWKRQLKLTHAPWGEIQGKNIIISVPTVSLKNLADPTRILKWWDRVIDTIEELSSKEKRRQPERFVCDIQISAGYMHSGYPIMTHLDVKDMVLGLPDGKVFNNGSWGLFHELGHHHQDPLWTFKGTGEVTVNLFTLYAMDKVVGIKPFEHPWLTNNFSKGRKYLKSGSPFKQWQSDPGLGLIMYIQLQNKFGWNVYKKIFKKFKKLPNNRKPKSEIQKRDFWMINFSKEVGYNLGPFFKMWGIPVSRKALNSIKSLPLWKPGKF